MTLNPILISLPVADRVRAHAFYRDVLGLEAPGELADDGVPEPLLFVLNAEARLMLVPTGGFGWVIGDHTVAEPGTSECVLGISAASVDEIVERARAAGASVAAAPHRSHGATQARAGPNPPDSDSPAEPAKERGLFGDSAA